jgi:hypothetical protein
MKTAYLTLILSCLSAAAASAGNAEETLRQRNLFCSQFAIEEQGTVTAPQWVSGTIGVARSTGDCAKIRE